MADIQHLELLRAGPSIWNAWRQEHEKVTPDLDAADLRESDLRGANLQGANLSEADLSEANLSGARLARADLWRATLDKANLANADVQGATARSAMFRGASLARANLCSTDLELADLRGASFDQAEMGRTILIDADLSGAKQLETCRFWAPVGIDFRTLIRSANLPVPFLRGCGVPEQVIENLPALFPNTIEYHSAFIRNADEDAPLAERLNADLMARGIRCWRTKPMGAQVPAGVQVRMEESFRPTDTRLIIVLSQYASRSRTQWLGRDVKLWLHSERAEGRKLLFVIRADDSRISLGDTASEQEVSRRAIDFRRWRERKSYSDALEKLAAALSS